MINPVELAQEAKERIPSFAKAKYMVVKMAPPKMGTIRDGLVLYAVLISFVNENGEEVEMVTVGEDAENNKHIIEFPFGKGGLLTTKFRGPKSYYRFKDDDTGKFYYLGKNDPVTKINSLLTNDAAIAQLKDKVDNWDTLAETDKDIMIDEYFESIYKFGLGKDLSLPSADGEQVVPELGMVTELYRMYYPPKDDEQYGNTIISKWPRRDSAQPQAENLGGDYKIVNADIAVAIYEELTKRDDTFDPAKFSSDEDII